MKRQICGLLSAMLIVGLSACGSPLEAQAGQNDREAPYIQPLKANGIRTEKDYCDGVINAARLTLKNGVAFWGFKEQLCSALLDENKDLYDFVSEGKLSTEIYSIALEGKEMYMATENGLVCLSLEEFSRDQSVLTVIDGHRLSNSSFQLYGDSIYFTYGRSLYKVPKEGGKGKVLEENIEQFQVTTEGIYCLNKKGELICVSLDGRERKTLADLDSEGCLFILKDKAYITTGDDKDYIFIYDLGANSYEKLHLKRISPLTIRYGSRMTAYIMNRMTMTSTAMTGKPGKRWKVPYCMIFRTTTADIWRMVSYITYMPTICSG